MLIVLCAVVAVVIVAMAVSRIAEATGRED